MIHVVRSKDRWLAIKEKLPNVWAHEIAFRREIGHACQLAGSHDPILAIDGYQAQCVLAAEHELAAEAAGSAPENPHPEHGLPFRVVENAAIPKGWVVGVDDEKMVVNHEGGQIAIPWAALRDLGPGLAEATGPLGSEWDDLG